jgi:hypothetical protein
MFVWGFLKWLKIGDGDNARKYAGYAFQMPTTAIIGLSLAAGLIALLGATERRPGRGVPNAIPTALAAASLLLAVGVLAGRASTFAASGRARTCTSEASLSSADARTCSGRRRCAASNPSAGGTH